MSEIAEEKSRIWVTREIEAAMIRKLCHVVEFRTARFDVSTETLNPINPIAGQSVLNWLREELSNRQYTRDA